MRIKRMPICQTGESHQISLGQKINKNISSLLSFRCPCMYYNYVFINVHHFIYYFLPHLKLLQGFIINIIIILLS